MSGEQKIAFVNPEDGKYYEVMPWKKLIDLAYEMGYVPATDEDLERAEDVQHDG